MEKDQVVLIGLDLDVEAGHFRVSKNDVGVSGAAEDDAEGWKNVDIG